MLSQNAIFCWIAAPFSFWKTGAEAPLDDYIAYCKRHKDEVVAYVNMDQIPGFKGKMDRSPKTIEISAQKSYDNLQIMKAAGLSPVPVFHQGEDFKWLERMLDDGETYIGISPYLRSHQNEIIQWMDKCFTRVTDSSGRPLLKTHGFGVTACNLCTRYPWWSVDSTSWSIMGAYGNIWVPQYYNGKPDYSKPAMSFHLSARKSEELSGPKRSFDKLGPEQKKAVQQAVEEVGLTMAELRNSVLGRWRLNMHQYIGMVKACPGNVFQNKAVSLFNSSTHEGKGFKPEQLRLYFATTPVAMLHNKFLNEVNQRNRLLSYALLRTFPDDFLSFYLRTGVPHEERTKVKKTNLKHFTFESYRVRRKMATLQLLERE